MCVIVLILKHLLLYQTTTSESFKCFAETFNTFNIVLLVFSAPRHAIFWLNQWREFRVGLQVCPTNSKQTLNLCEINSGFMLEPKIIYTRAANDSEEKNGNYIYISVKL